MSLRSMSEGDLGSIAKKMIAGAIDDTEQMARLHRAIYEELYFEAMRQFEFNETEKKISKVSSQRTLGTQKSIDESSKCSRKDANSTEDKNEYLIPSDQADSRCIKNANSKNQRPVTRKRSENSWDELRTRNNRKAFDVWKREKTRTMRRMWREERNKRLQELAAQENEIERKRASHEAYLRWKKFESSQRETEEMQRRALKNECLWMQEEASEKSAANEEAFRAWKKQKDRQSRQCRQSQRETRGVKNCHDFEFDSWLNQLDSVLHQKYMRERRYLVRSFYCQPAYYGSAALSTS